MTIHGQSTLLEYFKTSGICSGETIVDASLQVELQAHPDPQLLVLLVIFDVDADYEEGGELMFRVTVRTELVTEGGRPAIPFLLSVVDTSRGLANIHLIAECSAKNLAAPVMPRFAAKTTTELIREELDQFYPPKSA